MPWIQILFSLNSVYLNKFKFFLFKILFILKNANKKAKIKINQTLRLYNSVNFCAVRRVLGMEAPELHLRFYNLTTRYIFINLSIKKSKIHDKIGTRKTISFIPSFITCIHYLHSIFPHALIFSHFCLLFYMLYCIHIA